MSDHLPVLTLLKQSKFTDKTKLEFKSRSLNDRKVSEIKAKLFKIDWIGVLNAKTCNENFNIFCNKVSRVMDSVSPEKTVIISHKQKFVEPWMSRGIEVVSRKKFEIYKRTIQKNPTAETLQKYKEYRNHYNRLKRTAQTNYYNEKIKESKNKTKELWKVINQVIGKNKHRGNIISHITIDGLKTYSPKRITNELGQFYSKLGKMLAAKIKPGLIGIDEYLAWIKRVDASLILNPITVLEVEKIIMKLPNKTSYGHDKIGNILLKELCKCISFPLCSIFNQSLSEGYFPDAMKMAEIIPLYKGKEFDKVINYRPVSLLITISEVLEKGVYSRVYKFLEKHKVLYDSQYGFRRKRSCEQAVLELVSSVLQVKNQFQHSVAMFLDLSKAFDTLDHTILLRKLDLYGLRGICNNWFESYLKDRMLVTKLTTLDNKTVKSEVYNITYETAQGSCLGPLLFIVFCNDIHLLPTSSRIIMFADDTTLTHNHKNIKFLKYMLEHDMSILTNWYRANKLSLNVNKTVLLKFWPDGKKFDIEVEGVNIVNSSHTKFLGIMVDDCLTLKHHVNAVMNRIRSNKKLLTDAKNLLNVNALRNVYQGHICRATTVLGRPERH